MTDRYAFDVCTHNINGDGSPTPQWRAKNRILLTTETNDNGRHKSPVPRLTYRVWLPKENESLGISVSRRSGFLHGIHDTHHQVIRYHKSGKTEGWLGIRTPSRHVIAQDINLAGWDATLAVTHMLNSGFPPRAQGDRHTAKRRQIWEDLEWPKVCALALETHHRGRILILAGDMNRHDCPAPPGMERLTGRGLDHIFVSSGHGIRCSGITPGPKTGRTGLVHHGSLTAHLTIATKEKA